jgi:hypothetical protein
VLLWEAERCFALAKPLPAGRQGEPGSRASLLTSKLDS